MSLTHNLQFIRNGNVPNCEVSLDLFSSNTLLTNQGIGSIPNAPDSNGILLITGYLSEGSNGVSPINFLFNIPNLPPSSPNNIIIKILDFSNNNLLYEVLLDHNGNETGSTDHSGNTGPGEKPGPSRS